jgi:rare lipoprotein A
MYGLTAAHNTLPFDSNVLVHNLDTQKSVLVRINDRGPFVDGRIIDLSLTAARRIDMVGPGTARVRLTLQPAHTQPQGKSPQYTVQIGFFQDKQNAVRLRKELSDRYQSVTMTTASDGGFRVQVGTQKNRMDAEMVRQRLAEDGIKGFVRLLEK